MSLENNIRTITRVSRKLIGGVHIVEKEIRNVYKFLSKETKKRTTWEGLLRE